MSYNPFTCYYCGNPAHGVNEHNLSVCFNKYMTGSCFPAEDIAAEIKAKAEPKKVFGINGNTACPCGSKKKYKHCCKPK